VTFFGDCSVFLSIVFFGEELEGLSTFRGVVVLFEALAGTGRTDQSVRKPIKFQRIKITKADLLKCAISLCLSLPPTEIRIIRDNNSVFRERAFNREW